MKTKITLEINNELYLASLDKLDMTLDDFLEYCLSMFLHNDDEYSQLFQKACKHYNQLNTLKNKMYLLEEKNKKNKDTQEYYDKAMETVNRIHDKLGYIGRNQLRNIANQNNLNHIDLIRYVERQKRYNITNFSGLPKIK